METVDLFLEYLLTKGVRLQLDAGSKVRSVVFDVIKVGANFQEGDRSAGARLLEFSEFVLLFVEGHIVE